MAMHEVFFFSEVAKSNRQYKMSFAISCFNFLDKGFILLIFR